MLAEDLKNRVNNLSTDERHELSVYLTKLQLENDPEYWKRIKERSADRNPSNWINIENVD